MAINITNQNFDYVRDAEGVSVVQFTAPWCGPCRMLAPRLEEFTQENGILYFKVDIDEQSELAREFRVMSIPTLQWWKNGVLANTTVGVKSAAELKSIVEAL